MNSARKSGKITSEKQLINGEPTRAFLMVAIVTRAKVVEQT